MDKIDLDGNTLGGGTAPSSGSQDSSSSTKPSTKTSPKPSTNATLEVGKKYQATLSRCVDGDTAYFTVNGKTYYTRFLFVDTPESTKTVEPYGKEASQYTCSRLKSGTIYLETNEPNKTILGLNPPYSTNGDLSLRNEGCWAIPLVTNINN
ncbi:hypothetical protein P4494_08370 [Ureibacillus terrenus]|nr:hypothetical protein [Ureibacillus terrenus]